MPNWCFNKLTISGALAELTRVQELVRGTDAESGEPMAFDFNRVSSCPESLTDPGAKQAWCEENWGTKWNLTAESILRAEGPRDGVLLYCFESAWAPPSPLVARLAAQFPKLSLELVFGEPGAGFVGKESYANGEEGDSSCLRRPESRAEELIDFLVKHGLDEQAAMFEDEESEEEALDDDP